MSTVTRSQWPTRRSISMCWRSAVRTDGTSRQSITSSTGEAFRSTTCSPFPAGRDFFGNKVYRTIQVSVDEGQLRKVAEIGGGKFFVAMDTNSLNNIFSEIDKLEKTEVKRKRKTDWKDLFQWFIGAGVALAALHALLSQTRWRTVP